MHTHSRLTIHDHVNLCNQLPFSPLYILRQMANDANATMIIGDMMNKIFFIPHAHSLSINEEDARFEV